MFQKPVRIKNKALLQAIRELPCTACGHPPPSDPCHCKSVGAGGSDTVDNVFPACRACHSLSHSIGLYRFSLKYGNFAAWLLSHNWEFDLSGDWPKLIKKENLI